MSLADTLRLGEISGLLWRRLWKRGGNGAAVVYLRHFSAQRGKQCQLVNKVDH